MGPALEEIVWQLEHTPAKNKRVLLPKWRSILAGLIANGRISWATKDTQYTGGGILNPSSAPAPLLVLPSKLRDDLIRTSRKNYGRRKGYERHRN